jgi:hypothetical protein
MLILQMLDDFASAGQRFEEAHKENIPVVVFDNINVLAKRAPMFFAVLQGLAKEAADRKLFKVIFVSSDGRAPSLFQGKMLVSHRQVEFTNAA